MQYQKEQQQFHYWFIFAWLALLSVVECSWSEPGRSQYHIQTDEGPERYFRFRTDNGQFRKEKRLHDGTVIGTDAWIDADGFLRQKDYIADKAGYRILKSKTVYVGNSIQIEDAIKFAKTLPAQSGILVDGAGKSLKAISATYSTTTRPLVAPLSTSVTTTPLQPPPRLGYLSPAEASKLELSQYLGFDHYPDELPRANTPNRQYLRPHTQRLEFPDYGGNYIAENNEHDPPSTARPSALIEASPPSIEMEPPYEVKYHRLRPIAIKGPLPTPITSNNALDRGYVSSTTPAPYVMPTAGYNYAPKASIKPFIYQPTYENPLEVNNLEGLVRPTYLRHLQPNAPNDGVSSTGKGFRYYLPHQYHEEEHVQEKRAGSYGYVDPFGIRRVVYYNAAPGRGFVHRNSNRYVGLGAVPYDS